MFSGLPFVPRPEKRNRQPTRKPRRERQRRLLLERLEDRRLLATRTWDGGGGNNNWSTPANWVDDVAPVAGDDLQFAGTTQLSPVNDLLADTSFAGITFNSGAGAFTLSGNKITLTGNVTNNDDSLQTINLGMILSVTPTFTNSTGGLEVGGILSGAGGLTKSGTGTLTLNVANSHTGGTQLDGGTLTILHNEALGSGTFTINGGTIQSTSGARQLSNAVVIGGDFTVGGTENITLAKDGTNGINLNGGTRQITVTNLSMNLFLDGIVSNGGLTKAGNGRLALNRANTFAGGATVNAGTLSFDSNSAAGTGTLTINGGNVRADGATRTLTNAVSVGGNFSITGTQSLVLNGALNLGGATRQVTIDSTTNAATFGGEISNGGLTKAGTGTLTLAGNNSYAGVTNIQEGTLRITDRQSLNATTGATVVSNGATLNLNFTVGGPDIGEALELNGTGVGGLGALILTGTADVTLIGAVTLTTDASIAVAGSGALALRGKIGGAGGLTKLGTGRLDISNDGNDYARDTVISAGTLRLNDKTNVIPHGASAGNVFVDAAGRLELRGGNEDINGLSGSGTIDNTGLLGRTLTVGFNNQTSTFSGIIQNTQGPLSLTKQGTGTLTLSGANTYSGNTTISNGTLQLGASEVIPHGTGKGDVVMNGGSSVAGILDLNGFDETINGLDGTSAAFLGQVINSAASTAKTLTVGADDQDAAFAGLIKNNSGSGGTVALTKTGSGAQTLSGNNTYTGPTTVNAGTLLVNGSTAAGSDVTVNSGGMLGGTGTIYGGVSVQANGTTAPGLAGAARGVLNYAGGLTIASNGNLNIDLATNAASNLAGTHYDQANVSGGTSPNVNIAGANLNITASGTNPNGVEQLMIVKNDGDHLTDPVNGKFAGKLDGFRVQVSPYDGYLSYFDGDGNDITLTTKNSVATVVTGTAGPDSFTLRRVENTVQVLLGTAVHGAWPYDSLTSLTINGGAEADTLTILLSADGNPVPAGGVTFNGGSGNDTLDLSAYTAAMSGAVAGLGTTDGLRGTASVASLAAFTFDNLEVLTGGTASGDTLTGANLASVWNLDTAQTYVSTRTLTFSAFETLQGGGPLRTRSTSGCRLRQT